MCSAKPERQAAFRRFADPFRSRLGHSLWIDRVASSPSLTPSLTPSLSASLSANLKAAFGRGARQALVLFGAYALCMGALDLADSAMLELLARVLARALVLVFAVFTLTNLLLALFRPGARSGAVRLATICVLLVPAMVGFDQLKAEFHMWRAQSLAERTAPLIQRIQAYIDSNGAAPKSLGDIDLSGLDLSLDDFPGIAFNDNTILRVWFPAHSQADFSPPDPPRHEYTGHTNAPWELKIPVENLPFGFTQLVCFPNGFDASAAEGPLLADRFQLDAYATLIRHGDLRVGDDRQVIGHWGLIEFHNPETLFD